MKKISTPLIITSFRAKVDGSLGLSATTPELNHEEKVEFMELQSQNLMALFEPTDVQTEDVRKIKGELEGKSLSQRLYNVLFVWWKQKGGTGSYENFYRKYMEKKISEVKDNLDPK